MVWRWHLSFESGQVVRSFGQVLGVCWQVSSSWHAWWQVSLRRWVDWWSNGKTANGKIWFEKNEMSYEGVIYGGWIMNWQVVAPRWMFTCMRTSDISVLPSIGWSGAWGTSIEELHVVFSWCLTSIGGACARFLMHVLKFYLMYECMFVSWGVSMRVWWLTWFLDLCTWYACVEIPFYICTYMSVHECRCICMHVMMRFLFSKILMIKLVHGMFYFL